MTTRRTIGQKWRLTSISNKTISLATVVIAAAGILTFIVAILQFKEMRSAGQQTDRIIGADERLAKAMENSVNQSKTALEATIAQNQLDQRAWVGIKYIHMTTFEAGKKILVTVGFGDTGKTLARKANFIMTVRADKSAEISLFPYGKESETQSVAVFTPGLEFTATADYASVSQALDIIEIQNHRVHLFVYGEIHYEDIFGKSHFTVFCGRFTPGTTSFEACKNHNDAN